jgi:hypothetical protein
MLRHRTNARVTQGETGSNIGGAWELKDVGCSPIPLGEKTACLCGSVCR